ncbi:MAG: dihydroxy-acid dehydratase [Rhodobacterales bacterium]|nr:dihydroxy-acid dehydratase [Rhodobacterales bacterium]NCT13054.1 dihydroxy-acid dehydratase [Rhodobacterales bacterium]
MRRIGLVAALALLAGCDGDVAPSAMPLLDGAVTARGPDGYCVDQRASRPGSGFAVMAGCALISPSTVMPQTEGLVTMQVGPAGSATVAGAEASLAQLLRGAAGAQLLSAAGRADTVQVEQVEAATGVVIVRFRDRAPAVVAGLEQAEWRAFLDVNGHLTTIGVRGLARAPMSPDRGLRLLEQAIRAVRSANPAPIASAAG